MLPPFVLTEQDDDAEQDGHQGAGAEARPRCQRLGVAQLHVALAVARAHPDGQRAGAALHGEVSVRDDHGHAVDALPEAVVAVPPRQDPCRVVWKSQRVPLLRQRGCQTNKGLTFVVADGEVGLASGFLGEAEEEAVSSGRLVGI